MSFYAIVGTTWFLVGCGLDSTALDQRFSACGPRPPVVRSHLSGGPQTRPNIYLINMQTE